MVTRVLRRVVQEEQNQKEDHMTLGVGVGLMSFGDKGPQGTEYKWPLIAGKGKEMSSS